MKTGALKTLFILTKTAQKSCGHIIFIF